MTTNDILEALRAYAVVADAQAALARAMEAASEAVPVLELHGLLATDGELTAAGQAAITLLGQAAAKPAPARKGGNGWTVRTAQTDAELHAWIRGELEAQPDAGWAKLQNAYHEAGFASGWPRFKEAYRSVREAFDADLAALAAEAAAEPKRGRRQAG